MHLRMGTLFRDLKPENVVLSSSRTAKLTDFGFGHFGVESTGWSFGRPAGSPGYVAPEILRKQEHDSRADLYSLGVLIWVLLTGGLRSDPEPVPPYGWRNGVTDIRALYGDCQVLARCLGLPCPNDAVKLPSEASDFIARLTLQRREQRMDHAQVRDHQFLRPLQLPDRTAAFHDVEDWLVATASGSRRPSTAAVGSFSA